MFFSGNYNKRFAQLDEKLMLSITEFIQSKWKELRNYNGYSSKHKKSFMSYSSKTETKSEGLETAHRKSTINQKAKVKIIFKWKKLQDI